MRQTPRARAGREILVEAAEQEAIVTTRRGPTTAAIISVDAHEHCQRELELLRLLARGEKEIKAGKGHDLDTVLAEADALIEEMQG